MKRLEIVAVVLFLSLTCATGWMWFRQMANTHRIDVIEELYRRTSDRWTGTDHHEWCKELQRLNPDLKLPVSK